MRSKTDCHPNAVQPKSKTTSSIVLCLCFFSIAAMVIPRMPTSGSMFQTSPLQDFSKRVPRADVLEEPDEKPRVMARITALDKADIKARLTPDQQPDPISTLRAFLNHLSEAQDENAYGLVAPSSKERGDPIAYHAKLDFQAFQSELPDPETRGKFARYEIKNTRSESDVRVRIFVTLDGWDNDETLIVKENGRWYVADPIHIIR